MTRGAGGDPGSRLWSADGTLPHFYQEKILGMILPIFSLTADLGPAGGLSGTALVMRNGTLLSSEKELAIQHEAALRSVPNDARGTDSQQVGASLCHSCGGEIGLRTDLLVHTLLCIPPVDREARRNVPQSFGPLNAWHLANILSAWCISIKVLLEGATCARSASSVRASRTEMVWGGVTGPNIPSSSP